MAAFHRTEAMTSRPIARWLLAALLALMSPAVGAQTRFGLSPEAYAVFNRWMLSGCIGGEEAAFQEDLRRYPQALTRAFEQAIPAGPSAPERGRCSRASRGIAAIRSHLPRAKRSSVARADRASSSPRPRTQALRGRLRPGPKFSVAKTYQSGSRARLRSPGMTHLYRSR